MPEKNTTVPVPIQEPTVPPTIERLLKRIGSTDEFPTISKHLIEINQKMSGNTDASNASELAGVILQDYALTNKLLKLVNSAYYGFAAGKVSTVTRAVVVLGYEHVRLATLRLTLFDHFAGEGKSNTADLKEAIVASFWAGVLARDIAKLDTTLDPEEAFVCAMLCQLGKLLIIYYLPDDYNKICAWMAEHGGKEVTAVKAVCGVTYEELGMVVAKHWNFPAQICESMQLLPKEVLENKRKPPNRLWTLSSMVKDLCNLVQQNGTTPKSPVFKRLLEGYKSHIDIDKNRLKKLVIASLDHLEDQAAALDIGLGNSAFLNDLKTSFQLQKDPGVSQSQAAPPKPPIESYQLSDGSACKSNDHPQNAKDIIMEGVQEISEAMMDTYDINDVVSMSLEVLYRALNFNRALMFIQNAETSKMKARSGYGHNAAALVGALEFGIAAEKDLFNLSIQVGKDLIVADTNDAKLMHLIPQWYRNRLNAPAFIFLPVMFQKKCMGAFYADRKINGMPISDVEHRQLSMLRNQLLLAIKFRR